MGTGSFSRNGQEYIHANATATVTPLAGGNAGVPLTLVAVGSIQFELGAGSEALHGTGQLNPEVIVPTEAKPKWKIGITRLTQIRAIVRHLGTGAVSIPCDIQVTWQLPGQAPDTDYIDGTLITEGLGLDGATGSAIKDSIGGLAANIRPLGVNVLALLPVGGNTSGGGTSGGFAASVSVGGVTIGASLDVGGLGASASFSLG